MNLTHLPPWARRLLGLLAVLGPGTAQAATPTLSAVLQARYTAWVPDMGDSSPLAVLRLQGLEWDAATYELSTLTDDARGYAELRGVARLPGGEETVGVQRSGLYRSGAAGVLTLNDEWCAAGVCTARTIFVLLRPGLAKQSLTGAQVLPRLRDADLLGRSVPACLKGVTLGVQYVPSRLEPALTALATVPPDVRRACTAQGTELSLVTRPLRLVWSAGARRFVRGW